MEKKAHMKDDRSPFLETLIRVFLVTFVAEWGDKSQVFCFFSRLFEGGLIVMSWLVPDRIIDIKMILLKNNPDRDHRNGRGAVFGRYN